MKFTYLWVLQSVFEWVFDKILDPVFDWLRTLLSSLFEWVYTKLLYPVLEQVFMKFAAWVWKEIFNAVCGFVYFIYAQILSLIDALYGIFDLLSGLADVTYGTKQMPLLQALFQMDSVNRLFWMVNFMGLCLAFLLAVYAVGKSAMDLDFENRRPVGRVLASVFKCFIQLFTVQIMIMGIIYLSQLMLRAVNTAVMSMHGSTASSFGCILFGVTSMNASTEGSAYNLPASTANLTSGHRGAVYRGEISYTDISTIKQYFDLSKFDYVIGILLGLFLLIVFFACLLVFCQRIFDMLTLYIVSPLFVATIPLDDGEKFRKWREMFLGKTFSGFGLLFAMKFYIMLCPLIMDSRLSFTSSPEFDYLTKLVFLAGGALAVMKSSHMVTGILSIASAGSEAQMTAQGTMLGMMPLQMGAGFLMGRKEAPGAGNPAAGAGASPRYVQEASFGQSGGSGSSVFDSLKNAVNSFVNAVSGSGSSQMSGFGRTSETKKSEPSGSGVEIEMQVFDAEPEIPEQRNSSSVKDIKAAFDGGAESGSGRKRSASVSPMSSTRKKLSPDEKQDSGFTGSFGGSTSINDVDDDSDEEEDSRFTRKLGSSTSINDVDDDSDEEEDSRFTGGFGGSTSINDVDDDSDEEEDSGFIGDFGGSTSINDVDDDSDEEEESRFTRKLGSSTSINDVDDDSDEEEDHSFKDSER